MGASAVAGLRSAWRANSGRCVIADHSSLAARSLTAMAAPGDDSASSMRHAGVKLGRLCSFARLGRLGRLMTCSSSCKYNSMPQVNEDGVLFNHQQWAPAP